MNENDLEPASTSGQGYGIAIAAVILLLILAVIIPSFIKARNTSCQNGCINNLRMIDSGKEQAALANKWKCGAECGTAETAIVNTYIKGNTTPACPQGGCYTYNPIGTNPICSGVSQLSGGRTEPHRMPTGQ